MGQGRSTTTQEMPQFQEDYLRNTVLPFAQNIAETPFTPYQGRYAPDMSQYTRQAGDIYAQLGAGGAAGLAADTQTLMNPYQQNVIDASLAQMGRQQAQARTGLEANIIGSGAFGAGRRGIAEAEFESANLANQNALIANMMQQGYTQAQAAAMAQQQAQMQAAAGLSGVGAQETALNAAELEGAYNQYLMQYQHPYQQLQALLGGAAGFPAGTGTRTESYRPGLFDYISGIFSAIPRG